MQYVTISEFRSNLLKYLKNAQHGEQINVTSKGALLATVVPPVSRHNVAKAALEKLAKTAVIHDVVSPIGDNWDAME